MTVDKLVDGCNKLIEGFCFFVLMPVWLIDGLYGMIADYDLWASIFQFGAGVILLWFFIDRVRDWLKTP